MAHIPMRRPKPTPIAGLAKEKKPRTKYTSGLLRRVVRLLDVGTSVISARRTF